MVKSIIRQFDLPKEQADNILDEAKNELHNLAGNIESEEMISQFEGSMGHDDDNVEGWIDEREEMMAMEREELDESVGPLHLMCYDFVDKLITNQAYLISCFIGQVPWLAFFFQRFSLSEKV